MPASPAMHSNGVARNTLLGTFVLTGIFAAIAWQWSAAAGKGIVIGGLAGASGFWMMARNASTLTSIPKEAIPFRVYRWTFARMVLYAGALLFAYQADPDGQAALLGAAGGLFIARVVMLAVGVAAWRRKQDRGIGDR